MKKLAAAVLLIVSVTGCAMSAGIHRDFFEAKERAVRHKLPLVFMAYGQKPNTAGGVSVNIDFQNAGTQTLKGVAFSLVPYDEQGRQVSCEVNRTCATELKATGYFRPDGGYYSRSWENVWYSRTIKYIRVTAVSVTHMDGATQVINRPEDLFAMSIRTETWSFVHFWSGYPVGSMPETASPEQQVKPAPQQAQPIRTEPLK
jgi:hypothetical protein